MPFNLDHAKRTGEFAEVIFEENQINPHKITPRAIIPNDSKLFSQADLDESITYFVTSDRRSGKTFAALKKRLALNFEVIDISTPFNETFGVLDLN